ncbi:hypothetical protein E3N88_36339 [Mikania micrantha]|uniref:Uncharacterized protein n=1 Tax=Mikania micrantha TaxID=192012 RepID=A0A5N6M3H0_9ASTR|nr:hypothetical protein E3N88_36339 [Mikania micrantha]
MECRQMKINENTHVEYIQDITWPTSRRELIITCVCRVPHLPNKLQGTRYHGSDHETVQGKALMYGDRNHRGLTKAKFESEVELCSKKTGSANNAVVGARYHGSDHETVRGKALMYGTFKNIITRTLVYRFYRKSSKGKNICRQNQSFTNTLVAAHKAGCVTLTDIVKVLNDGTSKVMDVACSVCTAKGRLYTHLVCCLLLTKMSMKRLIAVFSDAIQLLRRGAVAIVGMFGHFTNTMAKVVMDLSYFCVRGPYCCQMPEVGCIAGRSCKVDFGKKADEPSQIKLNLKMLRKVIGQNAVRLHKAPRNEGTRYDGSDHETVRGKALMYGVGDVGDANKERTVHEAWLKSSDKQYHTLLRLLKLSVIGFATIILDKKQTTAIILCCLTDEDQSRPCGISMLDVVKCIGDNKQHMRESTLENLDIWFAAIRLDNIACLLYVPILHYYFSLSVAQLGADGRKELFDWLFHIDAF